MLQSAKNLVKFVDKVKPNEDAVISMAIRHDGEIEAFFYLHKGNGREIFAKLITCPTLLLAPRDTEKYIDLEGVYEGYKLRVTFLNERDQSDLVQLERADPKAGYPELAKCHYYWNYMTAEEWNDFIKEFYSINKNAGQDGALKRYLEKSENENWDFKTLVYGGFAFANTKNEEKWFAISERTAPIV
jgi:hypothetical protein